MYLVLIGFLIAGDHTGGLVRHNVLCTGRPWLLELDLLCYSYCGKCRYVIILLFSSSTMLMKSFGTIYSVLVIVARTYPINVLCVDATVRCVKDNIVGGGGEVGERKGVITKNQTMDVKEF